MSRSLLAPSESVRLCFRSELPGRWTLGESVAITVALESEAGVRIRHPHSHQIWTKPQSTSAQEAIAKGVPLRIGLEGKRAGRFLLNVSSSNIETGLGGGGGGDGDSGGNGGSVGNGDGEVDVRAGPGTGLTLDLSTGTACGWVTILPSICSTEPPSPPEKEQEESVPVCSYSAEAAPRKRRGPRTLVDCREEGRGVYLSIFLAAGWASRLNRPVLPLESLPAQVHCPPYSPAPPHAAGPGVPPSSPVCRGDGDGQRRALVARSGACNVRRLRFEIQNTGGHGSRDGGWRAVEARREGEDSAAAAITSTAVKNSQLAEAPTRTRAEGCKESREAVLLPPPPSTAPPLYSFSPPAGNATAAPAGERGDARLLASCTGGSTSCANNDHKHRREVFEVCAAESISLGGFFGTVWDCSLEMGAFLAALGPAAIGGKRVVELGAATGALSTLCAALGASEVVATDTKDLLPLLTFNLERNTCRGFLNIKACEYDWGSPVRRHPALAGNFDVVICSDLLYDPAGWEPLLESLRQLTARVGRRGRPAQAGAESSSSSPATVVYLAHRTRNPQERDFFAMLHPEEGRAEERRESTEEQGGKGGDMASFRFRKILEEEERGVRAQAKGGTVCLTEGCRGDGDGLVWSRGCFADVALYELSPVFLQPR